MRVKLKKEYDKENGYKLPKDHVMIVSNTLGNQWLKDGTAEETTEPLKKPSLGMQEATKAVAELKKQNDK